MKKQTLALLAIITLLIAGIVAGIFLYTDYSKKRAIYNTHIAPNVYYNKELISGKSFTEVEQMLDRDTKSVTEDITLSYENEMFTITSEELSIQTNTSEIFNTLKKANHNFTDTELTTSDWKKDFKSIYFNEHKQINVTLDWNYDTSNVVNILNSIETTLTVKPINAKVEYGYPPKITDSMHGTKPDITEIEAIITEQLATGTRETITIPKITINPKTTNADLPKVINVNKAERKIYLYDTNGVLEKTYRCAIGKPTHPTPTGNFEVISKLHNAPWYNPGSDWGKNMPAVIPAGPNNPMGVHKIGINAPAIFFHGIPPSAFSSIGSAASHGCMRMMPADIKDLYNRVEKGTKVFIR